MPEIRTVRKKLLHHIMPVFRDKVFYSPLPSEVQPLKDNSFNLAHQERILCTRVRECRKMYQSSVGLKRP